MELSIEIEKEPDFPEIYELVKIAFETSPNADGDEHDYVNNLRKTENYIPGLAFAARYGAEIIGHLMLTKTVLKRAAQEIDALLLSPVCTKLEYRGRGIASKLINHSLNAAKELGYKAVFLVGEPDYYERFGFRSIVHFGIRDTSGIPEQYTLGLELEDGFLEGGEGFVSIC